MAVKILKHCPTKTNCKNHTNSKRRGDYAHSTITCHPYLRAWALVRVFPRLQCSGPQHRQLGLKNGDTTPSGRHELEGCLERRAEGTMGLSALAEHGWQRRQQVLHQLNEGGIKCKVAYIMTIMKEGEERVITQKVAEAINVHKKQQVAPLCFPLGSPLNCHETVWRHLEKDRKTNIWITVESFMTISIRFQYFNIKKGASITDSWLQTFSKRCGQRFVFKKNIWIIKEIMTWEGNPIFLLLQFILQVRQQKKFAAIEFLNFFFQFLPLMFVSLKKKQRSVRLGELMSSLFNNDGCWLTSFWHDSGRNVIGRG